MYKILEKFLRVLHPFMPFMTEEIWQRLKEGTQSSSKESRTSIMIQPWPHLQEQMIDQKLEKQAQSLFNIVTQIRNLRASIEIKPDQKVKVSLYPHAKAKEKLIKDNSGLILKLAKLEALDFLHFSRRPQGAISAVVEGVDIYMHFSGLLDIAAEQQTIKAKISRLNKILQDKEGRMRNADFIKHAPKDVIEKEKESTRNLRSELERLEKMLNELR